MFKFQFPSNGKVYTKLKIDQLDADSVTVSIPFKREGIYKADRKDGCWTWWRSFNSLQTGRYIQREKPPEEKDGDNNEFQFPSNGKVYTKPYLALPIAVVLIGFNSLQTGRYIQRSRKDNEATTQARKFQFPSNGKVYTKKTTTREVSIAAPGKFQFPSNGKVYTKWKTLNPNSFFLHVSIPFKREGIYKDCFNRHRRQTRSGFNSLQTGRYIQSWQSPQRQKVVV